MKKLVKNLVGLIRKYFKQFLGCKNVWVVLLLIFIAAAVLAFAVSVIFLLPALLLFLAWNWTIPTFGGPTIGYGCAVGLWILLGVVIKILHGRK